MVLAGFVDIELNQQNLTEHDLETIKQIGDSRLDAILFKVVVKASKPQYQIGSGALLRKKKAAAPVPQHKVWTINPNDDDDEIVDEDDLLDDADLVVPPTAAPADCSTKKRACKDCTCGRAEQEALQDSLGTSKVTIVQTKKATSSCGSVIFNNPVLFGRCFPVLDLSVFGNAGIQAW